MADKDKTIHPYAATPSYSCSLVDGVLHVNCAHWLAANSVVRESGYDLEPVFESPFVHINFHTAVIGKDVKYLCEGCFNGCKNLRKIILSDSVDAIEWPIAKDAGLEYFEEDGLLFFGSENNPRLALVGCVDDYGADEVVIPSDTKVVVDSIDWPIHVKTLIYPNGMTISVNENVAEATGDDALPF